MDAKCPNCEAIAEYNIKKEVIKCSKCNFKSSYDEYIEIMKRQIEYKANDYILKWDE